MKSSICLLAILLVLPLGTQAQDEAPEPGSFIAYQQGILPGVDQSAQNELADSVMRPVLDAMVEEGIISNWGILTHAWGDEWNWNWYMSTDDHHSMVTAWDSVVKRVEERTPGGLDAIYGSLEAHKDNLYEVSYQKGRDLNEGEEPPGFMMLNQHQISDSEAANALNESASRPILDAMVDEGLINSWGIAQHAWADEWNWNFWMITKDHESFLSAWGEYIDRLVAANPNFISEFSKLSKRHRDNLYEIQYTR